MIRSKDIRERLKDIDDFLKQEYKESHGERKRDWRTYEQQLSHRIRQAMKNLEPLIDEAVSALYISSRPGRPHELNLKQRVKLLLIKELVGESNRLMSNMLAVFSLLAEIDVSYKTVERLYSDPEVEMALHNLHLLILKKKGVKTSDAAGDGTGYSLTISRHYATTAQKQKDKAKENKEAETKEGAKKGKKKKAFAYAFRLIDLKSRMYLSYGASLRSEKEAFDRAKKMLEGIDVELRSVRLDRYYSSSFYVDAFTDAKVYVIPKKNATLRGSWKWKGIMKEFVEGTIPYLEEYYQRNASEAGFSADKRMFGWDVGQKRFDRIDTALSCTAVLHNMFNLYAD